jgi:hypothetical protein
MPMLSRCAATFLAVLLLAPGLAWSQQDRAAEKAARRQQQQLQALQQQVSQAQAEKTQFEQDRAAMAKQLQGSAQAATRAVAAQRAADARLKAAESATQSLTARVAELEKALEEQRRASEQSLAAKDRELAQQALALKDRETERDQWQRRFGQQARLVTECGNKNDRLFRLNAELLVRYRDKGVLDAVRQREPALGLNDVEMFNLVQEYRDKAETERFAPTVERN